MFKHILVPLDGSKMSEAALPAAAFLAKKFDSVVTLFHVIEKNAPAEVHGQHHLKDAEEAAEYLKNIARNSFTYDTSVDFHVHTTEAENVADSIVAHAGELHHDVIVMCSHGRGQALHLFLGSIAQSVISKGSLPVLITHPANNGLPVFSCRSLLLPLDGNPEHEQGLPASVELTRSCGALLHLAVVIPLFVDLAGESAVTSRFLPGTMSRILEMSVKDAGDYLNAHLKKLKDGGIEARAHVLRGDPASIIDECAMALHADLIVLTTHGKSGMQAFWEGSVANKVSSLSSVPLLLIPVIK